MRINSFFFIIYYIQNLWILLSLLCLSFFIKKTNFIRNSKNTNWKTCLSFVWFRDFKIYLTLNLRTLFDFMDNIKEKTEKNWKYDLQKLLKIFFIFKTYFLSFKNFDYSLNWPLILNTLFSLFYKTYIKRFKSSKKRND